jgi:vitamin B12 transporter
MNWTVSPQQVRRVAAAMALLAAPAAAQEPADTFRLREVVVTATRTPVRITEAPGTVTVLTGVELQERGIRYVADALRVVPGAAVVQGGGPGGLKSVFMRGGESDYVQVLVDGIQVNDPGGAFDWAHLRTDDIDRIEIVRGPASVLYGSDAASGVVQIFTRAGGAPRLVVGAAGGVGAKPAADGTYRSGAFDASLTGTTDALPLRAATLRYGVNAAHNATNGLYAGNSDYDNSALSGRLQLVAPRADVALTVRGADNTYHYPTTGSGMITDREQFATGETRSVGVDAGYRLLPALEVRLLGSSYRLDARTEDPALHADDDSFWSTSEQSRRSVDARLNAYLPGGAVLTAGIDHERQAAATALESHSGSFGSFTDASDESRRNTGWYTQLHGAPIAAVAFTLGGRIDDNESFGTFRTARAALSWVPLAGTRFHAAWGTAFKAPTFYENFAVGFTRGNPDLEPEQVRGREAGLELTSADGRLVVAGTWFDQRFSNLIQYTFAPPEPEAPNFFNVGAARAHGLELSLRGHAGRLAGNAHYTLTSTRVTDPGFGGDMAFQPNGRLLRRPLHQAGGGLAYRASPALRFLMDAHYTGSRDDLDFTDPDSWEGVRIVLPDHTTVDAGVEFGALREGATTLELTLRVRNILDRRYEEIYNFPAAGRVVEVGMRAGLGL